MVGYLNLVDLSSRVIYQNSPRNFIAEYNRRQIESNRSLLLAIAELYSDGVTFQRGRSPYSIDYFQWYSAYEQLVFIIFESISRPIGCLRIIDRISIDKHRVGMIASMFVRKDKRSQDHLSSTLRAIYDRLSERYDELLCLCGDDGRRFLEKKGLGFELISTQDSYEFPRLEGVFDELSDLKDYDALSYYLEQESHYYEWQKSHPYRIVDAVGDFNQGGVAFSTPPATDAGKVWHSVDVSLFGNTKISSFPELLKDPRFFKISNQLRTVSTLVSLKLPPIVSRAFATRHWVMSKKLNSFSTIDVTNHGLFNWLDHPR